MCHICVCHSGGGICQTVKRTGEMTDCQTSIHPLRSIIFYPQSTGSDKRLQTLDPHHYRSPLQCLIFGPFFPFFFQGCLQHARPSLPAQLRHSENPWQLIYQGRSSQQRSSSSFNAQGKYFN